MDKLNTYSHQFILLTMEYLPKLALALVVLVVGLWLTERVGKVAGRAMQKRDMDLSLRSFLSSMITITLKVLLLITVAGMIGIETTSFVAILGAAGLAVGLALQGSLANFAGGVLVLVFKPFKVGDVIEAQGQIGKVKEIQIFNTILLAGDNKTLIIPNGSLANGNITNQTTEGILVVVIKLPLAFDADLNKVKEIALGVVKEHPKALSEPAPAARLVNINPDHIQVNVSVHVKAEDYWDVYFPSIEKIRIGLLNAGVKFAEINYKA